MILMRVVCSVNECQVLYMVLLHYDDLLLNNDPGMNRQLKAVAMQFWR